MGLQGASAASGTSTRCSGGPSRIEIKVDGKRCLVNTSGNRAFKKKYIVAFTQSVGLRGNAPTHETPLPATMQVDYIRVWR